MAKKPTDASSSSSVTREELIDLLNEDLAREYQAIIAYVVYSQVLKGAEYMNIAAELEVARRRRARPRSPPGQPDRLSRRHARHRPQAREDLIQGQRHAPLRSRQRERNDPQLPRARRPMRIARRIRHGRAHPRNSQGRTRPPDRASHSPRHRSTKRLQAKTQIATAEAFIRPLVRPPSPPRYRIGANCRRHGASNRAHSAIKTSRRHTQQAASAPPRRWYVPTKYNEQNLPLTKQPFSRDVYRLSWPISIETRFTRWPNTIVGVAECHQSISRRHFSGQQFADCF